MGKKSKASKLEKMFKELDRDRALVQKYTRDDPAHTPLEDGFLQPPKGKKPFPYTITRHAEDRYFQRFIRSGKYDHLDSCKLDRCSHCDGLSEELKEESEDHRQEVKSEIVDRMLQATEERSHINNSELMSFLWEKYGYDTKFKIMRDKDVIFIVRCRNYNQVVVTVLSMNFSIGKQIFTHTKYRKKRKNDSNV